ncbi:cellulase family glycosylhydrolase [Chitinophaga sp. MM2321]|uniref:cellulase family glycosylhydrolase n=1 Tax=Chitinophaga sp. MM2321 TaxID=3137178 RepID=UPI0032D58AD4
MKHFLLAAVVICLAGSGMHCSSSASEPSSAETAPVIGRPLFKDFMGINGHFTFRPRLYAQTCRLARSYHNIDWDVKAPGDPLTIPIAANQVNWKRDVYGSWKKEGFETDICIQFSSFGAGRPNYKQFWAGHEQWCYDYGKAMAAYYGPSGEERLCTSFEIGNEPGNRFDLALFKTLFKKMAQGIRAGDPRAKILTPAVNARKADGYSQDLNDIYNDKDILPLYDVINVHTYATLDKSLTSENTWNRSFPEDASLNYLKVIDEAIEWRNRNAKDKEVWVTEFGYDACTPEAMKHRKDWMLKLNWQGASDSMQAQYLVRSFLVFAARDVQRAYLYYYNDEDEAAFHAASGLTRNFKPKMSFWAVKQLYQTLGDYRFKRIVKRDKGELYVYEFEHGSDPKKLVWVAWSPTGAKTQEQEGYQPHQISATLDSLPGIPVSVNAMATAAGDIPQQQWKKAGVSGITLTIGESPVYIVINK